MREVVEMDLSALEAALASRPPRPERRRIFTADEDAFILAHWMDTKTNQRTVADVLKASTNTVRRRYEELKQ